MKKGVSLHLCCVDCNTTLQWRDTGTPGTPGAKTTIDGLQLPPPHPKFKGLIEKNAATLNLIGHQE